MELLEYPKHSLCIVGGIDALQFTAFIEVQLENALSPIIVTLLGIVTVSK